MENLLFFSTPVTVFLNIVFKLSEKLKIISYVTLTTLKFFDVLQTSS